MKKLWLRLILMLVLCLGMMPAAAVSADTPAVSVTVGDGTDTSRYVPSNSGYRYGKSQYLIPSSALSEINGKTITDIKWYLSSVSSSPSRKVKIVLSEMNGTTLDGLMDVSDQPEAFSGLPAWTVGSGNEILITFNTPYEYHGGDLLVTVLDETGSYESGNYFYGLSGDYTSFSAYSDSSKFSLASDGGSSQSFIPRTTLICGDPSLAPEAPVEEYDLWIGGIRVNENNAADLTQLEGVTGTAASYDPEARRLTLDGTVISGAEYNNAVIYSGISDLNVSVSGECSVTADGSCALYTKNLSIEGDGNLTLTGGDVSRSSFGIRCWRLSVSGDVTVNTRGGSAEDSCGLYASSGVYTSGNASLNAEGGEAVGNSYGIYSGDNIGPSGTSALRAAGGTAGYESYGAYVYGGNLRPGESLGESDALEPTVSLLGGAGGQTSYGLYFYKKSNYGISYGYVYLSDQKITISGNTAAVAYDFSNPPAPALLRDVPAAFVSESADGSALKLYEGSVKNTDGDYYKYLSTVPPEGFADYRLSLGGTRVNSMNAADIVGDGTSVYDISSNTLLLDGAVIKSPDDSYYEMNKAVCYTGDSPFTVEARGVNSLTGGGNNISYSSWYDAFQYESAGIYSLTDLTVKLSDGAELSVKGGYSYTYPTYGIWGEGSLTVTGDGTANIASGSVSSSGSGNGFVGARFNGDLTLDGDVDVTITSEGTALVSRDTQGGKSWSFLAPKWRGTFTASGGRSSVNYDYERTLTCEDGEISAYAEADSSEGTYLAEEVLKLSEIADTYKKLVIVPYEIPDSYTVILDPKGGSVEPAQITVSYQQPYELPLPEKEGYFFDGWYADDYMSAQYTAALSDNWTRMLRLSPWSSFSYNQIPDGSIIVFDVGFGNATPLSVDVNDRTVDASSYTIDGQRISGRIVMDRNLQYSSYGFLDINCDSTPYDYTVYKFMVFNRDDTQYAHGDTVVKKRPHTLYAAWRAPEYYPLYIAGTQVTSLNAADVLSDGTVIYDEESRTLILDGADISTEGTDVYEAIVNNIQDLTIDIRGDNTVTAYGKGSATGISSSGNLAFTGSGTLEVTAAGGNILIGISAGGNIELGKAFTGTLKAVGGEVNYQYDGSSTAVKARNILVSGGTLRAVALGGGECENTYAIVGNTNSGSGLTVSGGSVYAEAGPSRSMGIGFIGGDLTVTGGSFEARTLSENGFAIKVFADYNVTVGQVLASSDADGSDPVGYAAGDNDTYKWYQASFENPFIDVPDGSYYYDAVMWAVQNGITAGTSKNTFSPYMPCTRAQMVTFLWRAAGYPEPSGTDNPFTDVDVNAYYGKAVLWAYENGITQGTGGGRFDPGGTVTRAQTVTFLFRTLHGEAAGENTFTDVKIGAYYYEPVRWAVEKGITMGTGNGKFSPNDACLRAQIVTFLFRAYSRAS